MKWWKYSGLMIIITSVIHNAVGLIVGWGIIGKLMQEGLVNTIQMQDDRNAMFWFLATGFFWLVMGQFAHDTIKRTQKPLPRYIGWYLLVFSVIGCTVMPASGIWLFLPQSLIILGTKSE